MTKPGKKVLIGLIEAYTCVKYTSDTGPFHFLGDERIVVMDYRPTREELEQKVKQLEKEVQDLKVVDDALKDYIAYQSVLSVLRGVGPEQPEEMLFQIFLSEIVKQYGFRMSWYGQYSNGEIRPILSAGRVDRYLDNLVLEIREPTSPDAQCAMSQTILTGVPFTYADLERDEGFRQWRDYALELGYRSNLALPLEVDGQVEGGVMVYADTPNAFPEERIERLQLLGLEISAILSRRRVRQKAEEALTKSEQMYRTLVETSHDIIFIVDLKGSFLFTNKAFESILGYSDEDAKRINGFDLVHPEDLDSARKRFAGLIEGKREDNIEYKYRTKDGSYVHILNNASPIFDSQGNVNSAFGIARDVSELKRAEEALQKAHNELDFRVKQRTAELVKANEQLKSEIEDRKRAEGALKESEEKYRQLFEMESDAIFLIENSTGTILEVNQAASVLYGYSREEMLQKKNTDLSSESEDTRAATQERRSYVPVRYHRKKDNIVFPVEITARHFTWQGREVHIAAIRDITKRRRAEEALLKRDVELEAKSNHLEEVNTALKVLLKQREEDRTDLEEKVLSNVRQLVSPHLQRLKQSGLDTNQRSLVSTLISNLDNIVSPFTSKLTSKSAGFTPMEIRTADLVKEGKTNKEIGEILCLSPNTVKFHRYNLRNKLGLKNKKINLRSHLLSLVK